MPEIDGSQRFLREGDERTAILGWSEEFGVFAAFDVERHAGPLGGSPSIQIRQRALEDAKINGLALHIRGAEEISFGVRPDYLAAYLANMAELHACASSDQAMKILSELFDNPRSVDDYEIVSEVPEPRQFAVFSARKAVREANFKDRVLTAYSNSCAMCGVQLRLLDAAHILPVAHGNSTDATNNGVALCVLHHRAYDRGLVTFDASFRVHSNSAMMRELVNQRLDGGMDAFKAKLYPILLVPPERNDRPAAAHVEMGNVLRGWKL